MIFKEALDKYTKEELVEAIVQFDREYDKGRATIYRLLADNRKSRNLKSLDEMTEKSRLATNDYIKARREYNEYLLKIANKHNIVREDGTYKWDDWFNKATQKEQAEALSLEKDIDKKLKEITELNEEWQKAKKELL